MMPTLRGRGGGGWQGCKRCRRCRGCGVSECSGRPIFIFLLKKIGFAP